MSPRTKVQAARVLIPIAILLGIVGAVAGSWYVVVAMACLLVSQGLNYRANRKRD